MSDTSDIYKAEGNSYFADSDYISALTKYTEAICSDRENPILYSNRAITFLKLESWKNAILDCEKGLQLLEGVDKTSVKVKLLWRKAIGLRNLEEFEKALEVINIALKINPDSTHLRSELELINKEFSPELEETSIEMTVDTANSEQLNETSQTMGIIDIPIHEVDALPGRLLRRSQKAERNIPVPVQKLPILVEEIKPQTHDVLCQQNIETSDTTNKLPVDSFESFDSFDFPKNPSLQFLWSIKDKPSSMKSEYCEYLLRVPLVSYKEIFKVTGVDPEVLDMFLKASIHVLENNMLDYKTAIIQRLNLFTELPRFSLTSMFVDTKRLNELSRLFQDKLHEDFKTYWK